MALTIESVNNVSYMMLSSLREGEAKTNSLPIQEQRSRMPWLETSTSKCIVSVYTEVWFRGSDSVTSEHSSGRNVFRICVVII